MSTARGPDALDGRDAPLRRGDAHGGRAAAIVATETGMLHPLRQAAPEMQFIAANEAAHCRFMKMITLPKLRDALRDGVHEVRVPAPVADRLAWRSSGWSRSARRR